VNGALDWDFEFPYWVEIVYNNTYKPFISEEIYLSAKHNFTKEGGCHDLITQCRAFAQEGDPDARGLNETVNGACVNATLLCGSEVGSTVKLAGRPAFDFAIDTTQTLGQDPCPYYLPVSRYLNQQWTQQALGVPLNFICVSPSVINSYTLGQNGAAGGTGDGVRANRTNIEYLLNNDVKVAIINGDRDTRCPWNAAEVFALSVDYPGHEG